METPRLSRIRIHPIKSLDAVEVESAQVGSLGNLEHDRQFAFFDQKGKILQAKKEPRLHRVRADFDLAAMRVTLWLQGGEARESFHLERNREDLEKWLGDFLGEPVFLKQDREMGFPDDEIAAGPTVISSATLVEVASWYPQLDVGEMRRRLRSNLEIDGVLPFWEDRLYAESDADSVRFAIGPIELLGTNCCQRCAVPTRDTASGASDKRFTKIFTRKRQETLPEWAHSERFNHYYRIAVNTQAVMIPPGSKLHIGDELRILSDSCK